ncbi:hypothetical protein [Kibdelosporangium phytohabitans]|uniref:hypothetical protein n=1 Tax=Kibdelosporangium phytohabitans TaxID=860235 RepID=UPI0012FB81D7|nr:hypothetical protein [Kibdelosporangium phytohabitans]MBE1464357.1 hypothetical protein [Kibdelosporangium phytohabitans]
MHETEPGQSAEVVDLFDDAVAGMLVFAGEQHREIAVGTSGATREAPRQGVSHG